jgi:hypothetical protein
MTAPDIPPMTPAQRAVYDADCARVKAYHASQRGIAPIPAHAPLPPSAASHWVNCAGWLKMSRLFPARDDTPASLEGTAAHWVLSEAFAGRIIPISTLAPNGIAVTQEMHEGAELFLSNIPDEVMLKNARLVSQFIPTFGVRPMRGGYEITGSNCRITSLVEVLSMNGRTGN